MPRNRQRESDTPRYSHISERDRERIAVVEQDVENLSSQVTNLEKSVSNGFTNMGNRIAELAEKITSKGQVNWGLVVSLGLFGVTLIAFVVGGLASHTSQRIKPVENEVVDLKLRQAEERRKVESLKDDVLAWTRRYQEQVAVNKERIRAIEREVFPTRVVIEKED